MVTTLQQFKNQMKDLSVREGIDLWPNKVESAEIEARALAAGIQRSALVEVFEAYTGNPKALRAPEFDLNTMDVWLDLQRTRRSYLWPDTTVGVHALAAKAFSENGVLDLAARGALVSEVGEERATEMALDWGLSSLEDFKTKGVRPEAASQSLNGKIRELEADIAKKTAELNKAKAALPADNTGKSSNPFARLRSSDPKVREAAEKAIENLLRTPGIKVKDVAGIAASAGMAIDGKPLRR